MGCLFVFVYFKVSVHLQISFKENQRIYILFSLCIHWLLCAADTNGIQIVLCVSVYQFAPNRMWINSLVPFELRIAKVTDNRVPPPPHLLLPPIIYMTVSDREKKKKKTSDTFWHYIAYKDGLSLWHFAQIGVNAMITDSISPNVSQNCGEKSCTAL